MASAVEAKVREIICEQLGVSEDEVTPEASFIEDLGADGVGVQTGQVFLRAFVDAECAHHLVAVDAERANEFGQAALPLAIRGVFSSRGSGAEVSTTSNLPSVRLRRWANRGAR